MAAIGNATNPPIVTGITTQLSQTVPAIAVSSSFISNSLVFGGQSRYSLVVDRRGLATTVPMRVSVRVTTILGVEFNMLQMVWPENQEVFFESFHVTGVSATVQILNLSSLVAVPPGMQVALFGSSS